MPSLRSQNVHATSVRSAISPAEELSMSLDRCPVGSALSRRRLLKLLAASGLSMAAGWPREGCAAGQPIVHSANPLNTEPPLAELVASPLTPVETWFVRNHGPTPQIAKADFRLQIEGLVRTPRTFTVDELAKRFRARTLEATLTCAGNRRQELSQIRPVAGVAWDAGAISHGLFGGMALREVLQAAELLPEARHVWLEGLDPVQEADGSQAPFGGSIPLEKAMAQELPALLAHTMNGQPLTPEHGFPLRAVVPGYIGARSVKWLARIVVSDRPSPNRYVAVAYKVVQSDDPQEAASAEPIYAMPVNAAICLPARGARLAAGKVRVAGYALPSGLEGAVVTSVELSVDGGRTWQPVQRHGASRPAVWQLWSWEGNLPPGRHELAVRASDSRGQQMPREGSWNFRGYLFNAWHRVSVELV